MGKSIPKQKTVQTEIQTFPAEIQTHNSKPKISKKEVVRKKAETPILATKEEAEIYKAWHQKKVLAFERECQDTGEELGESDDDYFEEDTIEWVDSMVDSGRDDA